MQGNHVAGFEFLIRIEKDTQRLILNAHLTFQVIAGKGHGRNLCSKRVDGAGACVFGYQECCGTKPQEDRVTGLDLHSARGGM